jgi:predicted nucleic acid-binding protein
MTIVDSSVWIDFFNGKATRETDVLATLLEQDRIGIGDLILTEVLQGCRPQTDHDRAELHLSDSPCFEMVGKALVVKSARNYRLLRSKEITIRKTIDMLIGTFCIKWGHVRMRTDRDFDQLVSHLPLQIL